jgi:hypothetical protein
MSTIKTMIYAAEAKMKQWKKAIAEPIVLETTGKTLEEAEKLAQYFEGKYDALLEVIKVCRCE